MVSKTSEADEKSILESPEYRKLEAELQQLRKLKTQCARPPPNACTYLAHTPSCRACAVRVVSCRVVSCHVCHACCVRVRVRQI